LLRFRLKACTKCGGDLALDDGDWICLQCGTYYYVGLYGRENVKPVTQILIEPKRKALIGLDSSFPNSRLLVVTEALATVCSAHEAIAK